MLVARSIIVFVVGMLLTLLGCALPHAPHHHSGASEQATGPRRSASRSDQGETLIRVDQAGNVYRGGDASASGAVNSTEETGPQTSARRTSMKQAEEIAASEPAAQPAFNELASAIGQPQVDASRVAELVAAHERQANSPANSQIETPAAATPAATAAPRTTPIAQNLVSLPAGVFPTVVRASQFELEYDDGVLGEGGIAKVELYGTRDAGRTWEKLGEDDDRRSPYKVEMPEEGVFGFRIAVAGKNGLASRPPKNGELPELWVRVDLSEPFFRANLRPAGEGTEPVATSPAAAIASEKPAVHPTASSAEQASEQPTVAQASHVEETQQAPATASNWKSHLSQAIAAAEAALDKDDSDKPAASASDARSHEPLSAEDQQRLSAQLRMMYLAAERHEDAIKSSAHDATEQNEFWSHQMHGLKLLVEPTQSPVARQASAALAELREAADTLAARSELQVKSLAFCTAASSFGVYETTIVGNSWKHNDYSQRKFEPEQPIVLYFEVANFASEQTTSREYPDGAWRTSLRGSYTIVDGSGSPIEQRELKLQDDLCRNRRHDYYVAYKSWIPKLNPGRYSLELLVEDTIAGKIGTSSIDFEVVSN